MGQLKYQAITLNNEVCLDAEEFTVSLDDAGRLHASFAYEIVPLQYKLTIGSLVLVGAGRWIVEDIEHGDTVYIVQIEA